MGFYQFVRAYNSRQEKPCEILFLDSSSELEIREESSLLFIFLFLQLLNLKNVSVGNFVELVFSCHFFNQLYMLTVLFEFINVLKMHTETMHHKRITNIIIDQPEQLNNCHHKLFKI